jgi:hypothetical protein
MKNRSGIPLFLHRMSRMLTLLLIACAVSLVYAGRRRLLLPAESELLPALQNPPEQNEISERAFIMDWRGSQYVLHPVADYKLTGLVVSRNDIGGISDIYHTSDSVDVVDVCVVWGDNARPEVYKNYEFGSEPFSCWYRPKTWPPATELHIDELSNTHVLAKDESLARRLSRVHLGDQIRLRGRLVNYNPAGASEQLRRSSTVRTDTGNGACEVMYVEQFDLLKPGNPGWNTAFLWLKRAFLLTLCLRVLAFLIFPYLEYRAS